MNERVPWRNRRRPLGASLAGAILLFAGLASSSLAQDDAFLGEVRLFAGNYAPRGWAFCNGQTLPIQQNTALFSILGTTYGGDGRNNFQLPDLRGRAPVSAGVSPGLSSYRIGQTAGRERGVLGSENLPPHTHHITLKGSGGEAESSSPQGSLVAGNGADRFGSRNIDSMHPSAVAIEATGGSSAVDLRQPSIAIHYIICTSGLYPSRN